MVSVALENQKQKLELTSNLLSPVVLVIASGGNLEVVPRKRAYGG